MTHNIEPISNVPPTHLPHHIALLRSELLFDIQNMAHTEGQLLGEEESRLAAQIGDVLEDSQQGRISRALNMAYAECVEMLYPYTRSALTADASNMLEQPEVYDITLCLPQAFSQTTLRLLSTLCHEYMVCRALLDWAQSVKPAAAEQWAIRAEQARAKVQSALLSRRGMERVRRTSHPW